MALLISLFDKVQRDDFHIFINYLYKAEFKGKEIQRDKQERTGLPKALKEL